MTGIAKPPCDAAAVLSGRAPAGTQNSAPWVLIASILGSSMAFIDGTVVNVALPALQSDLHATAAGVQWVVEAYALLLGALLLLGGSLGDHYGRRRIFAAGVALFAAASVWCGLAPDITHLIFARGLQGIGGAMLVPGSLALISVAYPADRRGRAIGTWSAFTAITATIGPLLGGWLIEHASWRWVFFLNVPLAGIVLALTVWRVPESRGGDGAQPLDWLGAVLATVGFGGIVFALIEFGRGDRSVLIAGLIGVCALAAFVFVESRSRSPMVPLGLFASRNFSGANLLTFFLYAALSGALFFLPLNLMQVQGYTATQAGAALLPFILLMFLLSSWSGGLVKRYGAKLPLIVGSIIAGIGFALLARPSVGGAYFWTYFPGVVVLGLGMALSVAPLTTTVMNSVSQSRAGSASAINNAISRVGGLLAIALFGLVITAVFNHSLDRRLDALSVTSETRRQVDEERAKLAAAEVSDGRIRQAISESFVDGFRAASVFAVVLSFGSALSAALLIDGLRRPRAPV